MDERAPRPNIALPVELIFEDSRFTFFAISVNISETGVLLLSEEPRPSGSLIRFEFFPQLNGKGEIIWTREAEEGGTLLGMKFYPLRHSARNVLMGLLEASV